MDKISQLMDGELGHRESKTQISRLKADPALCRNWETYHLIGDTLRREAQVRLDFTHRLRERLREEPIIVAPHTRLSHRVVRYTLPMAAGVAGVTLVAWLALSFQQTSLRNENVVAQVQPPAFVGTPAASGPVSPDSATMAEYLTAHQEFSPSTAMQGVASYVRTVSTDESNAR